MKDLISKIYDRVAYSEPRSQELNLEYDQFIDKLTKPLEETLSPEHLEAARDLVYKDTYQARKDGFALGVQFLASLLAEALPTQNPDQEP